MAVLETSGSNLPLRQPRLMRQAYLPKALCSRRLISVLNEVRYVDETDAGNRSRHHGAGLCAAHADMRMGELRPLRCSFLRAHHDSLAGPIMDEQGCVGPILLGRCAATHPFGYLLA